MLFSTLVRGRLLTAPSASTTSVFLRFGTPVNTSRLVTRSFITTTQLAEPTKSATSTSGRTKPKPEAKAETNPKATTAKNSTKTAQKPAKTAKPNPKTAKEVKAVKVKKEDKPQPKKVIVRPEDKPPKRPPSPYFIFFTKFIKGQAPVEKAQAVERARNVAIEAGRVWKTFSEQEKQPFKDEHAELMKKYHKEYLEYSTHVSRDVIRELNARRLAQGKKKIRIQFPSDGRPTPPLIRFMQDFRPEFYETHSSESGNKAINAAKAAGEKWRTLSDAEKAKYVEPYHQELKAWEASKGSSSA